MKNVKNDTRYIIKKILIGVGIALILFNLKKCNVYAYSSVQTYQLSASNVNASWLYSTSDITQCNSNGTHFATFEYNDIKYNFCYQMSYYESNYNPYIIVFKYENDLYLWYGGYDTSNFSSDKINFNLTSNRFQRTTSYLAQAYLPIFNDIDSTNYYSLVRIKDSTITTSNVEVLKPSQLYEDDNYKNLQVIYNTLDLPIFINEEEISTPEVDPLANYTKVDLTGYQAVLLVPKNYQTMLSDSSHTNENPPGVFRTYLDLEYYSQECVRGTLINVENVQDIMLNNIGVGTGNIAESVTGTCYQEPTSTIMSYEFDQYSGLKARGLLVYNGSQDWQSGFGTETPFFGTSYVWYDSNLYNAYLVESFDNFNQTISYKDYSGTDKEVTIESLPTFTESMENAIENVDSPTPTEINKQKLQAIFDFLKTPFTFLNKLNTTSCSPIDLPFPRSNQSAQIQCLSSSVYDRYLPSALKSIIIIIINGLLFYRCTLSNIDIFTDILDPEDNKLEAIQL